MTQKTMREAPLGEMQRSGDEYVLRYERHLDQPVDRVWAALTQPSGLEGWLFGADELELEPGGEVALRWLNLPKSRADIEAWRANGMVVGDEIDDGSYVMHGQITELEAVSVFEFETDGTGKVRFDLRPEGDGSFLTFTCTAELPKEEAIQTLAGFHVHLDHLVDTLDGRSIDWPNWTRDHVESWGEMRERYEAESGDSQRVAAAD